MSEFDKEGFYKTAAVTDAMHMLDELQEAVAKNAGKFDHLREQADELYQQRVEQIAKQHNVDAATAHGLAASDEIAAKVYAISQELAAKQDHAHEAGSMAAAYVE